MARKARITHIQTGSERSAGDDGRAYDEDQARRNADSQKRFDQWEAEAKARGDKVYGPGAPDGMSPRRFWQR